MQQFQPVTSYSNVSMVCHFLLKVKSMAYTTILLPLFTTAQNDSPAHLNKNKIEFKLSEPGIQGH